MPVKEIIEQQRAGGFPAFVGSDLNVTLPLREQLLNELLQSVVFRRGPKGPITGAAVHFHSNNRFTADITTNLFWPKNIALDGAFAPTADFAKDPRLLLLLTPSALLGIGLKLFAGLIEEKAPFLTLSDNRLFVDVPRLLTGAGAAEIVPLIQTIKLRTMPGTLTIDAHLHVHPR